jgi:general secretion pathway protein I
MLTPRSPGGGRYGLTLLEVLVAMSIFLIALIGIARLITMGGEQAVNVAQQARAAQLCQSKLAEVVAGAVPLSGQSDVPFDEDASWQWSLDASQGEIPGIWQIKVTVSRERSDGSKVECSFDRMLLDPSVRGSALDAETIAANNTTNSSSSSSSSSSTTGTTGTSGTSGGGTAQGSTGGGGASGASGAGSSASSKGTTKGGN